MALYDKTMPASGFFRAPQYTGGDALIDKYGKPTWLGKATAFGLPILGTVAGAIGTGLTGIPNLTSAGNQLGKLGAQALIGASGDRDDDSAQAAQNSVGQLMGISQVGSSLASLATPFIGASSPASALKPGGPDLTTPPVKLPAARTMVMPKSDSVSPDPVALPAAPAWLGARAAGGLPTGPADQLNQVANDPWGTSSPLIDPKRALNRKNPFLWPNELPY